MLPSEAQKSPQHLPGKPLILVTHEFFPHRGGIAVYAAEMAKAATKDGYEVEVWAPALPSGIEEPAWPFTVHRLAIAGDHSLRSQWRMARHLRKNREKLQTAILYIPEPGPLLALLLLQYFDRLHTSHLVLTFHGSEIQRLSARRFLSWSTKHLLMKTARIGVVSEFAGELLRKHFPDSAS
jgi:glycosyltransferase involved in cell wall biosynthesis